MNIQNKLYTFFSPPDDQFAVSPRAAVAECQTCEFCKTPKKDWTPGKGQTPGQDLFQTHGNEESR